MNHRNKMIAIGLAGLVLGVTAASAVALINNKSETAISQEKATKTNAENAKTKHQPQKRPSSAREGAPKPQPQPQQVANAQAACDDGNVLGYVAGGVAGGVLGNQVGKGNGNTAATIGGTLGGAYLGGQALPLHNTLCR